MTSTPIDHDWIVLGGKPLSSTDRAVAEALCNQMVARPMLLNAAVTGGCFWPAETDAEGLAAEAFALLDDQAWLIKERCEPLRATHRVLQLLAAGEAGRTIAADEADKARADEAVWENETFYRMPRYA